MVWSCILCGVFLEKCHWANLVNSGHFLFPCLSVALSSVLRTATVGLCLLKEQVDGGLGVVGGAGCWGPGKLICILLVTKADHILVKTMCWPINRLHPPVSAWSSASVWSAFVTRCCLFCLEVQGQDNPAK